MVAGITDRSNTIIWALSAIAVCEVQIDANPLFANAAARNLAHVVLMTRHGDKQLEAHLIPARMTTAQIISLHTAETQCLASISGQTYGAKWVCGLVDVGVRQGPGAPEYQSLRIATADAGLILVVVKGFNSLSESPSIIHGLLANICSAAIAEDEDRAARNAGGGGPQYPIQFGTRAAAPVEGQTDRGYRSGCSGRLSRAVRGYGH